MALNGLFYADVLRPLNLIPLSLTLPTNTTLDTTMCCYHSAVLNVISLHQQSPSRKVKRRFI